MRVPDFRAALWRVTLIAFGICPVAASGQDILLSSSDGAFQIEGTLQGYDTEFYSIETAYGPLIVDATAVQCLGIGCPELGDYVAEMTLGGDGVVGTRLVPALMQAYALERGLSLVRLVSSDDAFQIELREPVSGRTELRVDVDFAMDAAETDLRLQIGEVSGQDRAQVIALDGRLDGSDQFLSERPTGTGPDWVGDCGRQIALDRLHLKTGDHPGAVPVSLVTAPGRLPRAVRDWMDWLEDGAAARVVRRLGFADLETEAIPLASQGARLRTAVLAAGEDIGLDALREMILALEGAARLTPTLRFAPGSSRPNTVSNSLIARLARDLEAGLYDGQEILLVGFSDGQGPADGNRRISERRAEAVRQLILERAPLMSPEAVRLTPMGFGEALPMACDDDDAGRQINRRVELWMRPLVRDTPPPEN